MPPTHLWSLNRRKLTFIFLSCFWAILCHTTIIKTNVFFAFPFIYSLFSQSNWGCEDNSLIVFSKTFTTSKLYKKEFNFCSWKCKILFSIFVFINHCEKVFNHVTKQVFGPDTSQQTRLLRNLKKSENIKYSISEFDVDTAELLKICAVMLNISFNLIFILYRQMLMRLWSFSWLTGNLIIFVSSLKFFEKLFHVLNSSRRVFKAVWIVNLPK